MNHHDGCRPAALGGVPLEDLEGPRPRRTRALCRRLGVGTSTLSLATTVASGLVVASTTFGQAASTAASNSGASQAVDASAQTTRSEPSGSGPVTVEVAGSTMDIELLPVPGPDGKTAFHLARTEITWDLYDVFVFEHDKEAGLSTAESDAVTRPSPPYVATDRGFGHNGYPAISISYRGAVFFCEWLSAKTGKTFRLPTLGEWKTACAAAEIPLEKLDEYAWTDANSGGTSHPPGKRKADALGVVDLFGNVAEWVDVGDRRGAIVGGSYVAPPSEISCEASTPYTKDWNKSDPQFPKSVWWLCDGGFIGFRVLCENP